MSDETTATEVTQPPGDATFDEIVRSGEAGVADAIAVYEHAEAHYFAAVSQTTPPASNAAYTTHT